MPFNSVFTLSLYLPFNFFFQILHSTRTHSWGITKYLHTLMAREGCKIVLSILFGEELSFMYIHTFSILYNDAGDECA